jgi:predicted RNA methylase
MEQALDLRTESRSKSLGSFYTPSELASTVARLIKSVGLQPSIILDPAAGNGELLRAASTVFPKADLLALEYEGNAFRSLQSLGILKSVQRADALVEKSWFTNVRSGKRLVFMNPPWGAESSKQTTMKYKKLFSLAAGQFDSYDLFVEKALSQTRKGDWIVAFLPDSMLLPQHSELRKMLLDRTKIHRILRLPEGSFPGVSMGCVVLILEVGAASDTWQLRGLRIPRKLMVEEDWDWNVLSRLVSSKSQEYVQASWKANANFMWPIEISSSNEHLIPVRLLKSETGESENGWNKWFHSGRGLEVGKMSSFLVHTTKRPGRDYVPVAVGEDLSRRSVNATRYVSKNESALNFKSELNSGQRLLVRKTGIGLKAAVADNVATTQTIFHFAPKEGAPEYALHYAAGFLTSRVVIAIQLAKSGSTEWRSHPYVTQRTIKELILPVPKPGSKQEKLAIEVANISLNLHIENDASNEEKLDLLVAKILGGGGSLVKWSHQFLAGVSGCGYVSDLLTDVVERSAS